MKDSLFEILLNLFEKTLSQIKENHEPSTQLVANEPANLSMPTVKKTKMGVHVEVLKSADERAIRVFTEEERLKFTKASYQFLMRMMSWGIIAPEALELIINRLSFSESRFVNLQETKWTIRNTLAANLTQQQLSFLDLVLYQREDNLSIH